MRTSGDFVRLLCTAALVALACARGGQLAISGDPSPSFAERIAASEYRASEEGAGWQAPNRAHSLRCYFDATGVRIHDRTGNASPLVQLSLIRLGRAGRLAALAPGADAVAHGERVEIRRPGIVEWYVNSPAGLEQGFTLSQRPKGEGELVLELAVAGARASQRGDAIAFQTAAGRTLDYGALTAVDAAGRKLAARFELARADRLRIAVDDRNALYPVAIDPLLTDPARLGSDQADGWLGYSVSGAGDVNGDGYGDVIVGAPFYDAGQGDEGAAFVFLGSASGIASGTSADAAARLESDQPSAWFGWSVAGAGDVNGDGYADVIVGAVNYDDGQSEEGAAFVFLGSGSGIASGAPASAATRIEGGAVHALLGRNVAAAGDVNGDGYGDVLVSGAFWNADYSYSFDKTLVFHGSATGIASGMPASAAALLESNQYCCVDFGRAIASAGDVNGDGYGDVVVGAYSYHLGKGAAFVFLGSVSGLVGRTPSTAATEIDGVSWYDQAGVSVAGAGDVNGDGYDDMIMSGSWEGYRTAFVFHGSATGIASGTDQTASTQLRWVESYTAAFGSSVAGVGDLNGDGYADVVVGSPNFNGDSRAGSAYVYLGSAAGIPNGTSQTAAARLEGDPAIPNDAFGLSATGAGDVNGDGLADLIVGAYRFDDPGTPQGNDGAAFVFLADAQVSPEPEPSLLLALASGAAAIAALARWRSGKRSAHG
jgi:hypothetical protein